MKPNLSLAASAAAALAAVVALSNIDASPHPVGDAASAVAPADGHAASATSGPKKAVPTTTAEIQAAVADWLPGKVSPTAGKPGHTGRTGRTGAAITPAVSGVKPAPVSARPVVPAHPVAMNDPAKTVPSNIATGTNRAYTTSGSDLSAVGPAGVALSDTFTLESRPGSQHTLFLDPRGGSLAGTAWSDDSHSSYAAMGPITLAAYTYGDNDPSFDADDLTQLQIAWKEVAADYAAFDINVTMVVPSDAALGRASADDDIFGTRVLLTSTPDPAKKAGGIAWLSSSTSGNYDATHDPMYWQPALDFSSSGDTGHNIAQTASHEAGHTWGLVHEGGSSEYYLGSPTWAPIMGTTYYSAMGQWSMGEFKGAKLNVTVGKTKAHQDEVATMRTVLGSADGDNGPDATATVLTSGATASGTIESQADVDSFAYSGTGGVTVRVSPNADITDLDTALDVVDTTADEVLTSGADPALTISTSGQYSTPTGGLDASFYIPQTSTPHTYLINVAGGGNGASPATDVSAYSAYGSLGTYDLSVTSAAAPGATSSGGEFSFDGITALTRTPGVPIKLDVDYNQGTLDPSGVLWAWKATPSTCKFSDPTIATPTLTCPATVTGAVAVTASVTASGFPAQTHATSFALTTTPQPAPKLTLSVAGQSTDPAKVCLGNTAAVRGTITDAYGRPIYGAKVRLYTNGIAKTYTSDVNGQVAATVPAKITAASPSYGIDSLASGIFPAQTALITRSVDASADNCFGEGTQLMVDEGDVVVVPGQTTPLSAKVAAADGRPVTGVPVVFTDTATATGKVTKLGSATTDATGTATYLLKGTATTPVGALAAAVAKSTVVTTALSTDIGGISVASGGITADFDASSFNIDGVTAFATDGSRTDKMITNVGSVVAGRVTAGYGATPLVAVGVPVTLAIAYPNPKGGADLVKKYAGKTDVHGWFRIALKNPVAGLGSISTAKSGLFPAVASMPFDDANGAQASFDTKLMDVSVVPSATTVAAGNPVITFTVTASNPWPNGAAKKLTAPDVSFSVRNDSAYYPTWKTKGGSYTAGFRDLAPGTWNVVPAASKTYTPVTTSFTGR